MPVGQHALLPRIRFGLERHALHDSKESSREISFIGGCVLSHQLSGKHVNTNKFSSEAHHHRGAFSGSERLTLQLCDGRDT